MDMLPEETASLLVLLLKEIIDHKESQAMREALPLPPAPLPGRVVLDMRAVAQVSSSGLALLKELAETHYRTWGAFPAVRGASHFIRESFALAGLEQHFVWLEGGVN